MDGLSNSQGWGDVMCCWCKGCDGEWTDWWRPEWSHRLIGHTQPSDWSRGICFSLADWKWQITSVSQSSVSILGHCDKSASAGVSWTLCCALIGHLPAMLSSDWLMMTQDPDQSRWCDLSWLRDNHLTSHCPFVISVWYHNNVPQEVTELKQENWRQQYYPRRIECHIHYRDSNRPYTWHLDNSSRPFLRSWILHWPLGLSIVIFPIHAILCELHPACEE